MLPTLAALAFLGVGAAAEEPAPAPNTLEIPLQLQIVLTRHQGPKTIASLPYTLSLNSGDKSFARVRAGLQVPLKFEGKDFPGNVVFKNVGTTVSCSARALDSGNFKVNCTIELGSVFTDEGERAAAVGVPPILTNFTYEATLTLREGQTAQYVSAADPLTGEIHKATLTLHVVK
jgi:hypothetical protein